MRLIPVLALLVLCALLLGGCNAALPAQSTAAPTDAPTTAPSEQAAEATGAQVQNIGGASTPVPARGYVLVSAGDQSRWFALEDEAYEITIRQTLSDGSEAENVIEFLPDGCRMASSSCENQDCVHQEEVTLSNRETRVLGNWIICLPNRVTLELYTPEDILMMSGQVTP